MRVFIFILTLVAFASAVAMAAEESMPSMSMPDKASPSTAESAQSAEEVYICPMHPHIHGKKGDKCPICGMDLVPADQSEPSSQSKPESKGEQKILYWYDPMVPDKKFDMPGKSPFMDMELVPFYEDEAGGDKSGALFIEPAYRQALGVRTAPAQMQEFGKSIHAFGSITPSTRSEYIVAVRKSGWIYDLKVSAVGDTVRKGDLLFTLYSPDLLVAQIDYLASIKGKNVIGNSEQRLRLYGMDEKAIAQLREKGKALDETPFYAPADGTITVLNVRKGSYVDPEDQMNTVLTLQDFSQVWIESHVPVKDLQFLSVGTPAMVTVDETGESLNAVVDTIYPMTDRESRKGMTRLVLDNPDEKLKTGSIVNVVFEAGSQSRLAIPAEAVLYGKDGGHVIEALGDGYFKPVTVQTGITAHGMTEIISGLKEGQSIVTSGQFMIDSESSLRGGLASMEEAIEGDGHDH
ncbi:MAG: efflux RND transporter periplasmic adaptor subunit [Alphaproteobacteria bacterium PRO2]|jgi:Cu(I)/Ag(I) efflux system membrane fusion protein|nr:efflux RND transporter periplasmic adaptor subunit [Alphaproteobacteria bacterium PRO2]